MYHHRYHHRGSSPPATGTDTRTAVTGVGGGYAASSSASGVTSSVHSLSGLSAVSVGSSVGKVKLPAQGILRLHVVRAESLPHVHLSPTTGPYLAVAYGKARHKTRINNAGGVSPHWNECFELYVSSNDARKQSVLFTVKNKKVSSSGGSGGGGAEDDNRSIISALSGGGIGIGSGSVILGVANVKLISLCAKERTLLIPLRQVGSSKPAGCIKVRVSFEPWNAGRSFTGLVSGGESSAAGLPFMPGGASPPLGAPASNPPTGMMNPGASHQNLQHQAKQKLMMMPHHQQHLSSSWRPSSMQNMTGTDQRDDDYMHGPLPPGAPPQPQPPAPAPAPAPARAPRSGLPPRGPSSAGRSGGYYRLEDSFDEMELVDTFPAYRRGGPGKSPEQRDRGKHLSSSARHHRRGGNAGARGGGEGGGNRHHRNHDHDRRRYRSSRRRSGRSHRREHEGDERDDSTARRDDVPSIVDCYDDDDDDHSAIDESELSLDHRGGGRLVEHGDSWERARVARPRVYHNPRDALVSTSKFLCF